MSMYLVTIFSLNIVVNSCGCNLKIIHFIVKMINVESCFANYIRFKNDPFNTNPISSSPNSLNAKANFKILFSKTYLLWYCFHTFAYDVGRQAIFLFIIHALSSVTLSLLLENMLHSLRIFDCTNPIGFKELPF